jgi:glycosyltransferase involved in cell wall biosynthesis
MDGRRPLRILFLIREPFPTFRPDVETLFGQELLSRGHAIDLVAQAASAEVTPGPHDWHGRIAWVGPTDVRDAGMYRLRRHWLALKHDLHCLRRASPARYDAIQVRDKFITAAAALFLARRRGMKYFYWLSFPEPESLLQRVRDREARFPLVTALRSMLFGWLLYRWILRYCDHAFVQSEQMRLDVAAHGISPSKLTAVPMGIARAEIRGARSEPHATAPLGRPLTLVYLGTLNAQRRLGILVEMLAILLEKKVPSRLVFIGDGDHPSDRTDLERIARTRGVADHLQITGFLPRAEALRIAAAGDIGLSPFFPNPVLRSTSPTKLVEYLALGLPVVANDHPEQREILHQSRGGVCVRWSARSFAKGVHWLARCSAQERLAIGERGRQWVNQNRTYGLIADRVEDRYQAIINGNARPAHLP